MYRLKGSNKGLNMYPSKGKFSIPLKNTPNLLKKDIDMKPYRIKVWEMFMDQEVLQ
jgi:hypothetical protein